ncbi:MAG TPA: alpha/beta hydrolase, partial [Terriglobales bacterium]|nr:alpha/beta hydrolase [Terriglobales bacterium]
MSNDSILSLPPPPADVRLAYGSDHNQFGDLRYPKSGGPFAVVMMIHGGFWRAKYDLAHAGHLCAALTAKGLATWNIEYRRAGNPGGGWPGTFQDIGTAFRFIPQIAKKYNLDSSRVVVMGHSAGGQLAVCLAAHEAAVKHVVSLAGVLDLQAAYDQHLSNDAVVEFL